MCGIVGLFAKSADVEARLGVHLAAMLEQMSDRGPDSAGVAVYRDPAPYGSSKLTLFSPSPSERWGDVGRALADAFGGAGEPHVRASHAVFVVEADATDAEAWVREHRPDLRVMSAGSVIEIYKETGLPHEFVEQFALADLTGTHALGHTRMATESRVTTAGSHPFSTGLDLCLVHNGSLSNHNRLRENLRREGIEFQTENDTEVAAGYLAWRMREGRIARDGARGLPRGPRRLLHVRGGHGRRLRRAARPDRMQARGSRRDGRLGRDGLGVAGDLGAPGSGPRRDVGAGAGRGLRLGEGRGLMAAVPANEVAVEVVDLQSSSLRELNQRLHDLAETAGPAAWRVLNPNGAHALACGIDADIEVEIEGHAGYYCAGMNKRATVRVHGNAGPGVAENMMSGRVLVDGNASQSAGATGRGGLLVVRGDASARCGISMKGIDIVVGGSVGHLSAFMAQTGSLVVCGDAGEALGDSIYEARLYVRGEVAGLGADCVEKDMRPEHLTQLAGLLEAASMDADPADFRRYGSARELYNFKVDNAGAY